MKQIIRNAILTGFVIFFISDKKNAEETISIEVAEYKTNAPIPGAIISFYKPGNFDLNCVCTPPTEFLTTQTDANGYGVVTETDLNNATYGLDISTKNYFRIGLSFPIKTRYELDFIAVVSLHLIKTNVYSGKTFMNISLNGERTGSSAGTDNFFSPSDSTFSVQACGGQTNTIRWIIFDSAGTTIADRTGQYS